MGRALAYHMSSLISVRVVAARGFSIRSQQSVCCSPAGDIVLDTVPRAALTEELLALVSAQGVAPAAYLRVGFVDPDESELSLGARAYELFGISVSEMMKKHYDIKHHWPLFNRALTIYYRDSSAGDLPTEQEMTGPGGLLHYSSKQHCELHGVQLRGDDHTRYREWKYSCRRGPGVHGESCGSREVETGYGTDVETAGPVDKTSAGSREQLVEARRSYVHSELCGPGPEPDPAVRRVVEFNSAPSVLTDTQTGAEFRVKLAGDLNFDYLVSYCTRAELTGKGGLPHRSSWGSVNPVLLMDDSCLVQDKRPTYVVTSRANLSQLNPDKGLCYNEVFLPGRPVSRLNLDIDLNCCSIHHKHLSAKGDKQSSFKLGRLLAISLISAIADTLNSMCSSTNNPVHYEDVGKVAVYMRESTKLKLSFRTLWYLPVELCSTSGIDAYHSLVKTLALRALCYELLSHPASGSPTLSACGMCNIVQTKATVRKVGFGSESLLVSSSSAARESAVDVGPYSTRKCVRLPNCHKRELRGTAAFEYVATFNARYPEPQCESPGSVSIGLSSNRIMPDVTSLGPGFDNTICSEGAPIRPFGGACNSEGVIDAQAALQRRWGVPTTVTRLNSGISVVRATRVSKHKCPIHNKVHEKAPLGAFVMGNGRLKYHCFVKKTS